MRFIDFLEMMVDGLRSDTKEVCHPPLRQPEGLAFKENLDAHRPIGRGIQDDLVVQWSLRVCCHFAPALHYSIYRKPTGILPLIWRQFCYNWRMLRSLKLLFVLIVQFCYSRCDLLLENMALRQQLAVLKQRHPQQWFASSDKLLWVILRRCWRDGNGP
jgi:hypothetical protein